MKHASKPLKPIETTLLREINFGIRENLPSGVTAEEAKDIIAAKTGAPRDGIVDHAESADAVIVRQRDLFNLFKAQLSEIPDSRNRLIKVLCVSHGGFIKSIMNHHLSLELTSLGNCSINVVEVLWNDNADSSFDINAVRVHDIAHLDF